MKLMLVNRKCDNVDGGADGDMTLCVDHASQTTQKLHFWDDFVILRNVIMHIIT